MLNDVRSLTVQPPDVEVELSIGLSGTLKAPDQVALRQDQLAILLLVASRCLAERVALLLALGWRRHGETSSGRR